MAKPKAKVMNDTSNHFLDRWCLGKQKYSCLETCQEVFQQEPSLLCLLTRAAHNTRNVCVLCSHMSSLMTQIHCYMPIPQLFDLGSQEKMIQLRVGKSKVHRQNTALGQAVSSSQPCPTPSGGGYVLHLHQIHRTLET